MAKQMVAEDLLKQLGVEASNAGACTGKWIDTNGPELVSFNPTDGQPLAVVRQAKLDDYERVISAAQDAFADWRMLPAPQRGEIVRQLGEELRAHKEPLGQLVSLEMGKILSEGLGEVQEMIDICDFAVGLSRQLYGLTMHSERPQHHHRLQFPCRRVGLERGDRGRMRRHDDLETFLQDPADRYRRAEHRQPRDGTQQPQRHLQSGRRSRFRGG